MWPDAEGSRSRRSLFQDPEEAENGLCILDAAVVDHSESFGAFDDIDFNNFVVVWIDLRFSEAGGFVEVHELGGESRRREEPGAFGHRCRTIAGFFLQLADCALPR